MKEKVIFTTALCLSAMTPMMAQNITGKVMNTKGEPLAFANVVLLNRTDSAFLKGKNGRLGSCVLNTPEGERVEKFDRIYLAIGSRPANRIVSTTAGIEVDEKGYVKVVERPYGMTTRRGVFAGGDVVHRPQTVVLAMKAAKEVAQGIAQYVDAIKLLEEAKRIEQQGTVE